MNRPPFRPIRFVLSTVAFVLAVVAACWLIVATGPHPAPPSSTSTSTSYPPAPRPTAVRFTGPLPTYEATP